MDLIEGSFALAAFIVIALPGLVYAAIRRWARGEGSTDRDFGLSVARGAILSVALTAVYLLIFGGTLWAGVAPGADADTVIVGDPRILALTVLGLYLLVPAAIAVMLNHRHLIWLPVRRAAWIRYPRSRHGYSDTPTPWDHAGRKHQAAWVRIRKSNGDWIGGWFTAGSYASAYPEPRAIYIDQQFQMTKEGALGPAIPGAGVFVSITDDDIVIWERDRQRDERDGVNDG